MKVCQAFTQLGHEITLLVPGPEPTDLTSEELKHHYGLRTLFTIEWLPVHHRRLFPWDAVRRTRQMHPDMLYVWPLQSAALGLIAGIPAMLELHDFPSGFFGPLWLRLFMIFPGHKRLLPISNALRQSLNLPKNITVVAPDGVDLERYTPSLDPPLPEKNLAYPSPPVSFAPVIYMRVAVWTYS